MKLTRTYFQDGDSGPTFTVEFDLDVDNVCAMLATSAYRNKARKATAFGTMLKAKVINVSTERKACD